MTQADPKYLGFDLERLARVEHLIDADIDAKRYDGAAIRVTRGGNVALSATRGFAERTSARRLESDAVFATMSVGSAPTGKKLKPGTDRSTSTTVSAVTSTMATSPRAVCVTNAITCGTM